MTGTADDVFPRAEREFAAVLRKYLAVRIEDRLLGVDHEAVEIKDESFQCHDMGLLSHFSFEQEQPRTYTPAVSSKGSRYARNQ